MLRRLLPPGLMVGLLLCLSLGLPGCDNLSAPHAARKAGEDSPAAEAAQLFAENVPFEFDFDLEDVNGKRVSKDDFAGKVVIVDVWGTWCPPCRMEIPHFVALNRQFGDQGLRVVGLNYEQVSDKGAAAKLVREFCKSEGVDYPCALITRQVGQQIPDLGAFPTTLFIDRAGKVRAKAVGSRDMPLLQAVVETLLKEKAPGDTAQADG